MPGPVSDSYDPEFSTGANATDVRDAITETSALITRKVFDGDARLHSIVEVAQGGHGRRITASLTEREWRLIRFSLNRATESI